MIRLTGYMLACLGLMCVVALMAQAVPGGDRLKKGEPGLKKLGDPDGEPKLKKLGDPDGQPKKKPNPLDEGGERVQIKKKKLEDDPQPPAPRAKAEDPRKVMARIFKNSSKVKDLLNQENTDQETRDIQKKIIEDIDKLIKRQNQDQNNNKKEKQKQSNKTSKEKKQGKQKKELDKKKPKGLNKQKPQPKKGKKGQPQPKDGKKKGGQPKNRDKKNGQPKNGKKKGGQPKGGPNDGKKGQPEAKQGKKSKDPKNGVQGSPQAPETKRKSLADLPKVWGHLPPKKQKEMDVYYRDRFMTRYERMLQRYYRTIAEYGRRER